MEEKEYEKEEEEKEGGMVKFPQTSFPLELETVLKIHRLSKSFLLERPHPSPPWIPDSPSPLYKQGL